MFHQEQSNVPFEDKDFSVSLERWTLVNAPAAVSLPLLQVEPSSCRTKIDPDRTLDASFAFCSHEYKKSRRPRWHATTVNHLHWRHVYIWKGQLISAFNRLHDCSARCFIKRDLKKTPTVVQRCIKWLADFSLELYSSNLVFIGIQRKQTVLSQREGLTWHQHSIVWKSLTVLITHTTSQTSGVSRYYQMKRGTGMPQGCRRQQEKYSLRWHWLMEFYDANKCQSALMLDMHVGIDLQINIGIFLLSLCVHWLIFIWMCFFCGFLVVRFHQFQLPKRIISRSQWAGFCH